MTLHMFKAMCTTTQMRVQEWSTTMRPLDSIVYIYICTHLALFGADDFAGRLRWTDNIASFLGPVDASYGLCGLQGATKVMGPQLCQRAARLGRT